MFLRVMCADNATECTGLWFFSWGLAALGGPGIVGPWFDKYHSYRYSLSHDRHTSNALCYNINYVSKFRSIGSTYLTLGNINQYFMQGRIFFGERNCSGWCYVDSSFIQNVSKKNGVHTIIR